MEYENGDKYEGEFKNNLKEGKGIMNYNNGDIYDGEWKNDLRDGKGKMIYEEKKEEFEGEWENDKEKNGEGMIIYKDNINDNGIYIGKLINSKRECEYGIMNYNNGDKYEGEFKNNLREGKGIMNYNNGDKYEGEWKNNLREGKGIYYYNNNDKYEGEYKNNEIVKGKGEMIFQNYIICEYLIKNNDEINILNCFEEVKKKYSGIKGKENEKELREFCELYLNEEKISLNLKKKLKINVCIY